MVLSQRILLLSTSVMLWWLSILSFFFLLLHLFHQINRSRVLPVQWPVLGMVPGFLTNVHRRSLSDYLTSVLRASGGTFVIKGPWFTSFGFVLTCDPANANHMFNAHFSDYPKGEDFADIFDTLGNGIFSVDGKLWSEQRRMAHALLSSQAFRSSVARCSRGKIEAAVLPLLRRAAASGRAFDLQDFFKRLSMDVTSTLVIGVDPGCLALDSSSGSDEISKCFEEVEEVYLYRHLVPWWRLQRWLRVGGERRLVVAEKKIEHFLYRCIRERKTNGRIGGDDDVLTSYMHQSIPDADDDDDDDDDDDGHKSYFKSDTFLRDTLVTFMAAGKDTTSAALSWFFWLLLKNPSVEEKIVKELKKLRPAAKCRQEEEEEEDELVIFDAEVIEGAVYLHAAVSEALRLYPPVPFNHKTAVKEDVLPSGHRVGPGTMIIFSGFSTARMESVWGEDCLEFKPERWISPKGEVVHVPSYKFMAFHSGPRSCVGKNMAITMIKMVAASMIYNFHFREAEGCRVEPKMSIVLQMEDGFMVKAEKRSGISI